MREKNVAKRFMMVEKYKLICGICARPFGTCIHGPDFPPDRIKVLMKATREDRRIIKRLRKLNATDREIALALDIPEDSLLLQEP